MADLKMLSLELLDVPDRKLESKVIGSMGYFTYLVQV